MISYCGNGSFLDQPWLYQGLSPCFYFTLTSAVLSGVMLLGGGIQALYFRKHGTSIDENQKSRSSLYSLQILLSLTMCVEPIVYLALQGTIIRDHILPGYQILNCVALTLSWMMATYITYIERHYMLPTIPTRGHGLVLLVFLTFSVIVENLAFLSLHSPLWWFNIRNFDTNVELGMWCWRYVATFLAFVLGLIAPGTRRPFILSINSPPDDSQVLIDDSEDSATPSTGVGRASSGSTWRSLLKKVSMLWPFMWPQGHIPLQFCVLLCMGLLVAGRIVNLFIPIFYKKIIDSLTIKNMTQATLGSLNPSSPQSYYITSFGGVEFRWDYILIYVLLWFLQGGGVGGMGFLNNARTFLWIWVQQFTTREVEVRLFGHLHSLSLRWHLGRKTGEVLRVMDRGTNSINSLLNYIVFSILPTIADIIIAIVYFLTVFNAWFALIVFLTMAIYLTATIGITEWRTRFRRDMNKLDNEMNARAVDSLLNFETVKYYGAENFEVQRYKEAILKYQKAEWVSTATLNMLNTAQNLVITGGLLTGTLLCARYVTDGKGLTVGDYVLFSTYVIQLYAPLNWFGTYYRMIQQSFVDMENMFDLLSEKQEVKDTSQAAPLVVTKGTIEFRNVCFHYQPSMPILKNLSFTVPEGQTFALVGSSGAGKSTVIRLLFRFYDIQSGSILIDGQDISQVQQDSLRAMIGVVPQDTVLFNNDIMYNIRYGRVGASDNEVEDAARTADIHERILSFPEGYNTMVGERGLKLSGGEKQRVAIARTVLKAPQFVLLDEATSALDTQTERNIQTSLARVCENRTTLIVAHRLSTIISAHQILVFKGGEIVERGTHDELLLRQDGVYAAMWMQQQTAADSGEETAATAAADDSSELAAIPISHGAPTTAARHGHGH